MSEDKLITQAVQLFGPKLFTRLSQSEVCDALGLLDQKRMAGRLGLTYEAFRWRLSTGRIPRPAICLGKRAYYTEQQANQISADALEIFGPELKTSVVPRQGGQQ